ncbi:MAG: MFS transporter [Gammaproteobacteria bacterium]
MKKMQHKMNSLFAWLVCLSAALFFFYEFIQLNLFDAISENLINDFSLNPTQLGQLSSMYFYGNLVMVIPAGMLLDRFSTKLLISIAMAACTLATFFFAITTSLEVAIFCRLAEGLGAGFCFLAAIRLASRWFSADHLAFVTGVVVTMAMIGGTVAQAPLAMLSEAIGWRHAVIADAILGVILLAWILFFLKDRPHQTKTGLENVAKEEKQLHDMGVFKSLLFVFKNHNNWLGGLYTSLLNLPIFILGALWGILYLQQEHGLTHTQGSYVTSMLFVGVIFGSPAFGWFSDRIHSRRIPMIIGAISSLFIILAIMFITPLPLSALLILFFLLGFLTSSQVIAYPAVAELNPIELTGSALSIISFTIMISGLIAQPLFGWFIQLHSHRITASGHFAFLHTDFLRAMSIMPIAFVLGLVIAFIMKETGCKSKYEHLPKK